MSFVRNCLPLLLVFSALVLPACQQGSSVISNASATPAPLVPELAQKLNQLNSISIKYGQSVLNIVSRNDIWYLDSPDPVRVAGSKLNQALSELIQTPRGQQVTLSKADYKTLHLCTNSESTTGGLGVEVTLQYDDPQDRLQMVLGTFDVDKESDEAQLFGDQVAARRYVRILNDDKVYLTPSILDLWDPNPSLWESTEFPPIRQLEHLVVTDSGGFSWKAAKTSSYSAINFGAPFETVETPSQLIKVFASFFQHGFHDGIVNPSNSKQDPTSADPLYTVEAKDRFGGTYKISVLRNYRRTSSASPQEGFRRGLLTVGDGKSEKNPEYKACLVDIELADADKQKQNMVETLRGREILFIPFNFEVIEQITADLKRHEQTK